MNIAFWNTHHNKNINDLIVQLTDENHIDLFALAEYKSDFDALLYALGKDYSKKFHVSNKCKRIKVFGRLKNIEPGYVDQYCAFHIIDESIVICFLHLQSKLHESQKTDRVQEIQEINNQIRSMRNSGYSKFIVIGDFNANPYESEMINRLCFNALPDSKYVFTKRKEQHNDKEFPLFYNPMWNLFGDFTYPPGTYYYDKSSNLHWHIFDQVIISNTLVEQFKQDCLKIITRIGNIDLFNKGGSPYPYPNISDHYPIVFSLSY